MPSLFSLDIRLVKALKKELPLSLFIETGTFKGDTVAAMLPYFERLVSIELSNVLWEEASKRFINEERVQVLHGDSAHVIFELAPTMNNLSTLYWLDAHWCVGMNTSGEISQSPSVARN